MFLNRAPNEPDADILIVLKELELSGEPTGLREVGLAFSYLSLLLFSILSRPRGGLWQGYVGKRKYAI